MSEGHSRYGPNGTHGLQQSSVQCCGFLHCLWLQDAASGMDRWATTVNSSLNIANSHNKFFWNSGWTELFSVVRAKLSDPHNRKSLGLRNQPLEIRTLSAGIAIKSHGRNHIGPKIAAIRQHSFAVQLQHVFGASQPYGTSLKQHPDHTK